MAMEKQAYREAMARLGAAVNVITTDGPGGRAGFTASAVCSVTDSPPTLLIHGTADNDVPVTASEVMAAQLAQHRVAHELITIPGAGHGLGKGDKKLVADAHERALAFIRRHLK